MSSIYQSAIQHYCAYQERCHSEVRYKLVALGARGDELEDLISDLIQNNYLDEERYACTFVRSKFIHNHWGRLKIIQSLEQKQVSEYCIKKGLKEIDDNDYLLLLNQLLAKKWYELKNEPNLWNKKAKAQRYLYQKGFENDLINKAMQSFH